MKPSIFEFDDYREYLLEVLSFLKQKKISQRKLAFELGVSPAILTMIISKKRGLKPKLLTSLVEYLELKPLEVRQLELLTILNDSTDKKQKELAYSHISLSKSYQNLKPKESNTYKYLSTWENVAIREMTELDGFQLNASWIKKRLLKATTLKKIQECISFLLDHELITRKKNSSEYKAGGHLNCVDGIYKLSLGKFHSNMLSMANESIEMVPSNERLILGHTVTLSEENFEESNKILQEALEKIKKLNKRDQKNTRVYHFEMASFPLTKK
ncbi:MAG: hypothetical protein ACJAT2_002475 [Bacteriovoracaceae bacterium]|jgi:uncharacterized protein (TIGR02147 family)